MVGCEDGAEQQQPQINSHKKSNIKPETNRLNQQHNCERKRNGQICHPGRRKYQVITPLSLPMCECVCVCARIFQQTDVTYTSPLISPFFLLLLMHRCSDNASMCLIIGICAVCMQGSVSMHALVLCQHTDRAVHVSVDSSNM